MRKRVPTLVGFLLFSASLLWATSWTAPRTWVALETVTASLLNTHLRDNLLYLKEQADAHKRLTTNYTAVGNVGAGEDDLITYSVPAATLATDGQVLRIEA